MLDNYLQMLEESLLDKIAVLNEITEYNTKQQLAFSQGQVDLGSFDEAIAEKDRLIEKIRKLDEGFESLFARISAELNDNKEQYADRIRRLQELIREVTDKSVTVQTQEARNKQLVEQFFSKARNGVGEKRTSVNAAFSYYRSMSGTDDVPPQFLDSKN